MKDKSTYFLGEDVQDPYGGAFKISHGLSSAYPLRVLSMPMSEQSFVGFGIGLALSGARVLVEIMFSDFLTLTADQLINHAAKFHKLYDLSIPLVIRTPSGGYRGYGATHSQSLEKLFFGIPGLDVWAPNILSDPIILLEECLKSGTPTVFIENKLDYQREMIEGEYKNLLEIQFSPLLSTIRIPSMIPQISLVTYGGMVQGALDLMYQLFMEEEIVCEVIVCQCLSPLPSSLQTEVHSPRILIIEEGHQDFGWASEVAFCFRTTKDVKRIGAKMDVIGASLMQEQSVLPQWDDIEKRIKGWVLS
ncbi:MAG: hypothetical protein MI717_11800 [Spirochaetales bacterium]|nr:hypothetical protein [Spirochaetales bacterium]